MSLLDDPSTELEGEDEKKPKKRTSYSVSIELEDHARANTLLTKLSKRPEYKHLSLKVPDILRMCVSRGIEEIESDLKGK